MRTGRGACAVLLTICASAPALADEVDRYLEAEMRRRHIPGLSLAVVRDGRIVKARGYGLADLEHRVPATASTVYEIGSVSKQFTAAAVLKLAEQGKLTLADPVAKFLPEAPASWSRITLRHLLQHTSGIQNHVAVPGFMRVFRTNLLLEHTPGRDELLDMFFKLPLEFEPGETWAYDNTGYYLLGIVIEKASGKRYWEFLEEQFFKPLGMASTRSTDTRPVVPHRAAGYEWVDGAFENRPPLAPFVAFSAGMILSTVEDMAKWDAALHGDRVLQRSTLEKMWTPARTPEGAPLSFDYGFGWFVDDALPGHRIVQHSGGTPGFSSTFYRFVDDRLTVILLTNHSDRMFDPLAIEIAGMYLPALKRPQKGADPDPVRTARLKAVVAGLLKGRYDSSAFTEPMRLFLSTATGRGFWQWIAAHGELGAFDFSDLRETRHGRIVRYGATLAEGRHWCSVNLSPDGKIAQIYWW